MSVKITILPKQTGIGFQRGFARQGNLYSTCTWLLSRCSSPQAPPASLGTVINTYIEQSSLSRPCPGADQTSPWHRLMLLLQIWLKALSRNPAILPLQEHTNELPREAIYCWPIPLALLSICRLLPCSSEDITGHLLRRNNDSRRSIGEHCSSERQLGNTDPILLPHFFWRTKH